MTDDAAQEARLARLAQRRSAASRPAVPTTVGLPPPSPVDVRTVQAAPTGGEAGRSTSRRRRPHAASGSRIAAAGLGLATMFGIVAVFGFERSAESDAAAPAGPTAAPSALPPALPPALPVASVECPGQPPAASPVNAPTAPIVLTAQPVVRIVQANPPVAAPAPAAQQVPAAATEGSG